MADLTGTTPSCYIDMQKPEGRQVSTEAEMIEYLYNADGKSVNTAEDFLDMVFESNLLEGYEIMPTETYRHTQLVSPSYLPENFTLYDGVFVKLNPDTGGDMILRLWYDFESKELLTIVQFDAGDMTSGQEFTFLDTNISGSHINAHFQRATHYCSLGLIENGLYISGHMIVNGAEMESECMQILHSIA